MADGKINPEYVTQIVIIGINTRNESASPFRPIRLVTAAERL
jgi:hypothetical protein